MENYRRFESMSKAFQTNAVFDKQHKLWFQSLGKLSDVACLAFMCIEKLL